jgi:uncharacterized protein (DUF1499 family)
MHPLLLPTLAAVLLLVAPLGARAGLWSYFGGFGLMAAAIAIGLTGAVVSLIAALKTQAAVPFLGAALGVLVVAVPMWMVLSFRGAPAIHDLTTDTADPPRFDRVLALRTGATNRPEYDGDAVAVKQRAAYPDLQPLILLLPPEQAFQHTLAAVEALHWRVAGSDPAAGSIEAVDTTFWFGFKDDVAVRIRAAGSGSRIDVRSKSRVGMGDGGANARRIRALLTALRSEQ